MWLGGTDEASEGHYVWASSGAPLTFSNWYPGDPDGALIQNCITMWQDKGEWIDDSCSDVGNKVKTLCEILFDCA